MGMDGTGSEGDAPGGQPPEPEIRGKETAGRVEEKVRQPLPARLAEAGPPGGEMGAEEVGVLADLVTALRVVHFPREPHSSRIHGRKERRRAAKTARALRLRLARPGASEWRYNRLLRGLGAPERAAFDILLAALFQALLASCPGENPTGLQLAARVAGETSPDPGRLTADRLLRGAAHLPVVQRLVEEGLAVPEESAPVSAARTEARECQVAYSELLIAPEAAEALFPSLGRMARASAVTPRWLREIGCALEEAEDDAERRTPFGRLLPARRGIDDVIVPAALREQALLAVRLAGLPHRQGEPGKPRGVCMVFSGPPGTGKTLMAEAVATEMNRAEAEGPAGEERPPRRRLHLVDYAAIASAYVGENEKRLSNLFRRWRRDREVLLFDEADSLVSRRIAAAGDHDAVDMLQNRLVNILLKELENLRGGVVILATNFADSLDPALERRAAFRLRFEEPGPAERERLWRAHVPGGFLLDDGIDFRRLAEEYALTGGLIRNAMDRAALVAELRPGPPDACPVLTMEDLVSAAREEAESRLGGGRPGGAPLGFRVPRQPERKRGPTRLEEWAP